MEEAWTCGKGLAATSPLPAKLAELIDAVADTLQAHMPALDLSDPNAMREYGAYEGLVAEHRKIAAQLKSTADMMAGYRDLPMARHDPGAMAGPKPLEAFQRFVRLEREFASLLSQRLDGDGRLLHEMRGTQDAS